MTQNANSILTIHEDHRRRCLIISSAAVQIARTVVHVKIGHWKYGSANNSKTIFTDTPDTHKWKQQPMQ